MELKLLNTKTADRQYAPTPNHIDLIYVPLTTIHLTQVVDISHRHPIICTVLIMLVSCQQHQLT